jgi:hypothetical protein
MGSQELRRLLLAVACVAGLIAGCGDHAEAPKFGGGVTVTARLDGTLLRTTFTPEKPGFHLYSLDLPAGGVDGLGVATAVTARGSLQAAGKPAADEPIKDLRIDKLGVTLPVYPDGPVTVTLPVRRDGGGRAEAVVTYAACSPTICLPPVRDRVIGVTSPDS